MTGLHHAPLTARDLAFLRALHDAPAQPRPGYWHQASKPLGAGWPRSPAAVHHLAAPLARHGYVRWREVNGVTRYALTRESYGLLGALVGPGMADLAHAASSRAIDLYSEQASATAAVDVWVRQTGIRTTGAGDLTTRLLISVHRRSYGTVIEAEREDRGPIPMPAEIVTELARGLLTAAELAAIAFAAGGPAPCL